MLRRWRQVDQRSGIYIVGCGPRFIKIGWSDRIGNRLRQLEETTPEFLTLYRTFEWRSTKDERRLHRYFQEYRYKGEWFLNAGKLKDFVGEIGHQAPALPETYVLSSALLLDSTRDLPPFPEEPPFVGPPTMYQRYLDLVDSGGGRLLRYVGANATNPTNLMVWL